MVIYAYGAVIDGTVSFQAGTASFQVQQTLAEAVGAVAQLKGGTILAERCQEI